ncbi:MAG: sulfatase-like hydrolase/transferase, partial [Deltaproteobacteria bacterium]|nr:sulfatase-like hydrolase/transferase [Deltaproteobacteria bacterium]
MAARAILVDGVIYQKKATPEPTRGLHTVNAPGAAARKRTRDEAGKTIRAATIPKSWRSRSGESRVARRARLLLATLCVAACGGDPEPTASQPVPAAATTPQPNVVLVTWDTVRADHIAAPGTPRHLTHTPHWDRLAAEGVVFVEARSPTPMT